MINVDELGARIIFSFGDGSFYITESTLFGFIVALVLAVLGIWLGSRLEEVPRGKQIVAEFLVGWVYKFTEDNMGKKVKRVPVNLDAGDVAELQPDEISAILRAADELIGKGGRTLLSKILGSLIKAISERQTTQ